MLYKKQLSLFAVMLLALGSVVALVASFIPTENYVVVAFLDIGQGDAIYVEAPTGEQMLVDAGPDRTVLARLSEVMPWLDRSLDVLVATHPDQDHIGGMVSVLDAYQVDRVVTSGSTAETDIFQNVYERVLDEGSEVSLVRRGSVIQLGEVTAEVLFPEQIFEVSDRNVNSIVLRVTYDDNAVLLTGDAGIEQELYLVDEYGEHLESDILKLGHHGSKSSSAPEFLKTVNPDVAIVSAGVGNRYGHPNEEVVKRVTELGVPILSTQDNGSIVFVGNGQKLWQE